MTPQGCNCGWGGQHDTDNPRCNLNAAPSPRRVVTPQEAQDGYDDEGLGTFSVDDLVYTVKTEPERICKAVVTALRSAALLASMVPMQAADLIEKRADAIKNGAKL